MEDEENLKWRGFYSKDPDDAESKGHEIDTPVMCCAFAPKNWWVYTGGADHSICKWDLVEGKKKRHSQWAATHEQWVRCIAPHPSGDPVLVSSGSDGFIALWDTRTVLEPKHIMGRKANSGAWSHSDWVTDLKWCENDTAVGGKIYSCSWDSTIKMYDMRKPALPAVTLAEDMKRLNCMELLDKGKFLVTGGNDARVRKFVAGKDEQSEKQEVKSVMNHIGVVNCLAKHPEDEFLISGGQDRFLRLMDMNTLVRRGEWQAHDGAVTSIAFGESGYYMFSTGEDNFLKQWNVKLGFKEQCAVRHEYRPGGKQHFQRINDVAVKGKYVASVGNDGALHLWEIPYDSMSRA